MTRGDDIDGQAARVLGRPPSSDGVATRRAIIAAAASHLGTTGYDAMTMDVIANEVGITKAAIYRYFRSKQDLVRAAVVEVEPSIRHYYDQFSADAVSLGDRFRALIRACMEISLQHQQPVLGYFQMGRLADRDEELAVAFRERSVAIRQTISELVNEAIDRHELPQNADKTSIVEAVSGLLWAMTSASASASNLREQNQLGLACELLLRRPQWETNESIVAAQPGRGRTSLQPESLEVSDGAAG
jgi:AcrR family transcriptional regulator